MIKVGKRQKLKVNNIASVGAYLDAGTENHEDNILLPKNEFEGKEIKEGDELNVFIYRDSEDRLIATLRETAVTVGELKKLEVVDITEIGAFMSWGLLKDILLPRGQEEGKLEIGQKYLVGIYTDKKERLAATMQIYKFLSSEHNFKKNDFVKGTVYRIEPSIGVFVAVEDKYFGLIPKSESLWNNFKIADEIEARVIRIREDGKIDLSPRQLAYLQMENDSNIILEKMKKNNGIIKINDDSSPELIKKEFNMSKKSFKRAIGRLLKNNLIEKTENYFKML